MDKVEKEVESLAAEIATLAARLDAATHRLLECIRHFDASGGWYEQGAHSCSHWLSWRLGWDRSTAREKVRVARALGGLPAIDEALRTARLSYAKVRALTRVATPQTEAGLLEMALVATGAQLEVLCRGYRAARDREEEPRREEREVRQRLLEGGMVKIEMILEADEADLVMCALERAREVQAKETRGERRRRAEGRSLGQPEGALDQPPAPESPGSPAPEEPEVPGEAEAPEPELQSPPDPGQADASAETPWPSLADGVLRIAESFLAGHPVSGTGGERYQVVVHLDQEVLGADGDWAATLEDGTRVSPEAFRRVACDCGLLAAAGDGEALNIGRRARSIPPALRRALMLRDSGCAFPGCTHRAFLHAHHLVHWLHGGETSLENTVLLCTLCRARGGYEFRSPDGRLLTAERPRLDGDTGEWLRAWTERRGLDLGPEVNEPQWDGTRPDYNAAVQCLLEIA